MNKLPRVLVSCVTNRGYKYLNNIINNFSRQVYPHKKLVIIFNSNDIEYEKVNNILYEHQILYFDIKIIPDNSLGYCLNKSIEMIPDEYNIWCKMDDDDYYGKNYLMINLEAMLKTKADIVGRRDMYVYVPDWNRLYFRKNGGLNKFVKWVQGATLFVKKDVFNTFIFSDKNRGEDTKFCQDAIENGFKIYATSYIDYIVIRRYNNRNHTWKIDLPKFLRKGVLVNNNIFKDRNKHIF